MVQFIASLNVCIRYYSFNLLYCYYCYNFDTCQVDTAAETRQELRLEISTQMHLLKDQRNVAVTKLLSSRGSRVESILSL